MTRRAVQASFAVEIIGPQTGIVHKPNDCPFSMRADKKGMKGSRFVCVWKQGPKHECFRLGPPGGKAIWPEDCPLRQEITIRKAKEEEGEGGS